MLHILFWILKIIGIILLLILGIVLLALCAVLFVPVRYQIATETEDGLGKLSFHGSATWILKSFWAFADYENKEFNWQVRLFWKRWNRKEETPKEDIVESDLEELEEEFELEKQEEQQKPQEKKKGRKAKIEKKKQTKKQNIFHKIKCTIQIICDKIRHAWNIKEEIIKFLKNDVHKVAYQILKKEILIFLKHLRPRTLQGHIRFGMEDPYNTGRILALLSSLYPFYGDKVQIYPEFDQVVLEGELKMKGRIYLFTIVKALWILYCSKEIRKTYHDYKQIKKSLTGGN